MTYEECMRLVEAYTNAVTLAEGKLLVGEEKRQAEQVRDYLGEFVGTLLETSCIGDRHELELQQCCVSCRRCEREGIESG